jgi:hypothetical protein
MGFMAGESRRRVPSRLVCGLLSAAVLAAAVPASAMADASPNIRRSPGDSAAFTLAGSNGYSLYFKSEKRLLTIIASQRRPAQPTISADGRLVPARLGATSESIYSFRGVSHDPRRIEADLGPAGSVSLVFQPSGEKKATPIDLAGKSEKCIGATKVVRRLGSFVGSVSFHGENGYTTAEATSVPGTVGTSPFRNCTQPPLHPAGEEELPERPTFLSVSGDAGLLALRDPRESRFFALDGEELADGFFVMRSATATGSPSLFSFSPDGRRARVRPPAPFSGTGVYSDPADGPPTWSGDLSVSFPGVQQPLTGEEFVKPVLRPGSQGSER